jgi:hypothetical protein
MEMTTRSSHSSAAALRLRSLYWNQDACQQKDREKGLVLLINWLLIVDKCSWQSYFLPWTTRMKHG